MTAIHVNLYSCHNIVTPEHKNIQYLSPQETGCLQGYSTSVEKTSRVYEYGNKSGNIWPVFQKENAASQGDVSVSVNATLLFEIKILVIL